MNVFCPTVAVLTPLVNLFIHAGKFGLLANKIGYDEGTVSLDSPFRRFLYTNFAPIQLGEEHELVWKKKIQLKMCIRNFE
jgi:hypothetical protein